MGAEAVAAPNPVVVIAPPPKGEPVVVPPIAPGVAPNPVLALAAPKIPVLVPGVPKIFGLLVPLPNGELPPPT